MTVTAQTETVNSKHRAERAAYLRMRGKVTGFFALQKRKWTDRKEYKCFRCKQKH